MEILHQAYCNACGGCGAVPFLTAAVLVLAVSVAILVAAQDTSPGWRTDPDLETALRDAGAGSCEHVASVNFSGFSAEDFAAKYHEKQPLLILEVPIAGSDRLLLTKSSMLRRAGSLLVSVEDGHLTSYSVEQPRQPLCDVLQAWRPLPTERQSANAGSENLVFTFYDNKSEDLIAGHMQVPMPLRPTFHPKRGKRGCHPRRFVSLAPSRGSITLHNHDASFFHLVFGRKLWIMYPPGSLESRPEISSQLGPWNIRPVDADFLLADSAAMHCAQPPDSMLYIPSMWWHGTASVGESAGWGVQLEDTCSASTVQHLLQRFPNSSGLLARQASVLCENDSTVNVSLAMFETAAQGAPTDATVLEAAQACCMRWGQHLPGVAMTLRYARWLNVTYEKGAVPVQHYTRSICHCANYLLDASLSTVHLGYMEEALQLVRAAVHLNPSEPSLPTLLAKLRRTKAKCSQKRQALENKRGLDLELEANMTETKVSKRKNNAPGKL